MRGCSVVAPLRCRIAATIPHRSSRTVVSRSTALIDTIRVDLLERRRRPSEICEEWLKRLDDVEGDVDSFLHVSKGAALEQVPLIHSPIHALPMNFASGY